MGENPTTATFLLEDTTQTQATGLGEGEEARSAPPAGQNAGRSASSLRMAPRPQEPTLQRPCGSLSLPE